MIAVDINGYLCYMVDAKMIKPGNPLNTVLFKGKIQRWPKSSAWETSPGRWAMKTEFWDIMQEQQKFKKTVMAMAILRTAKRRKN
jgi:hypothetical protein